MATTDGNLAADAIDGLVRAGVRFAFLHKEAQAAAGALTSDADLVTTATPEELLTLDWGPLSPVMASRYDQGCTAIWLATKDAKDGVQLDFTHAAGGRLGVDPSWLDSAVPGVRWAVVSDALQGRYVETKRVVKAGGGRNLDVSRVVDRVLHPCGWWVHSDRMMANEQVAEVGRRFAAFLPRVDVHEFIPNRLVLERQRRRPALVLTQGWPGVPGGVDLVVDERDPDAASCLIVSNLAARLTRC